MDLHDVSGDRIGAAPLYRLLQLRAEVFVVEQECRYLDPDGLDLAPTTRHLWLAEGDGPPASSLRILRAQDATRIGRVVTAPSARGAGHAGRLLEAALATTTGPLSMSAQAHLADWYGRFGFVVAGPGYLEDGIPHLPMRLDRPPG